MTPINKILQVKLQIFQWEYLPAAKQAFQDWRIFMKEAAQEPTTTKELIMGDPESLGGVDESVEGVGGGLLQGKDAL